MRRAMMSSRRVGINSARVAAAALAAQGMFSTSAIAAQANPKVFFDVAIGGEDKGRIVMELRADGK